MIRGVKDGLGLDIGTCSSNHLSIHHLFLRLMDFESLENHGTLSFQNGFNNQKAVCLSNLNVICPRYCSLDYGQFERCHWNQELK